MIEHLTSVEIVGQEHIGIVDFKKGRFLYFVDFTHDGEIDIDVLEASIIWRAIAEEQRFTVFIAINYPELLPKLVVKRINARWLKQ